MSNFRKPRPQAVGDSVNHPNFELFRVLHGVLPPVRLLHAHAENSSDGLAAEGGAVLLCILP
ncbi:MAG TPA: hypothetical protein VMZ52_12030, partial [Bryobacteraceae bacterium]|nr:hypothetical protein [Bryobacteraceae bacterium]